MPMLILDNFEIIRNHIKNIKRVIVGTVGIAIVLLILSIGMSDADIETDVSIGEDISRWSLPKAAKARLGKGGINVLAFSPDQTVLVRAFGFDIELWDLATEVKLTTLKGHTSIVNRLIFSPDGKTLVSAGRDGTILLWDWDVARAGSEVTVD